MFSVIFTALASAFALMWANGPDGFQPLDFRPHAIGFSVGIILGATAFKSTMRAGAIRLMPVFALPCLVPFLLIVLNGKLDASAGEVHRVEIVEIRGGGKSFDMLFVKSWREGEDKIRLNVLRTFRKEARVGGDAVIEIRPGVFGWPWVSSIEVRRPEGFPRREHDGGRRNSPSRTGSFST